MRLFAKHRLRSHSSNNLEATNTNKGFRRSVLQCFRPSHPTENSTTSVHRCLLIPEIFDLVLEFIRQDDGPPEANCTEDRTVGKRTLASLARTCRTFSAPALDVLWMRLDSLDPLIKVLPSRMWAKKHSMYFIRVFMTDKHWLKFQQYAARVQYLRGPCRNIPPTVQRRVVAVLASFRPASLPLLPNLTELVWSESDTFSVIDPTVSLVRYFAGPRVTTISLFLVSWPIYVPVQAALADLPNLCPNVTEFTAITRASLDDYSQDVRDIASRWSDLRVLRSCPLSQTIVDELTSLTALSTLSIELDRFAIEAHMTKLPPTIHTFSLAGSNALYCIRYIQSLHGTPTHLRLHIGLDLTLPLDMDALFQMLPTRFDADQLQSLTVTSKSPCRCAPALHSFPLTEPLLETLYPLSALVTLDLNAFCTSELDDAAYGRMAAAWPALKSLKIGAEDLSRARPMATVGAVIAVLKFCPHLETLHIVFDGSILPPPPTTLLDVDRGAQCGESAGSDEESGDGGRIETRTQPTMTSLAHMWGVANQHITQLHVGHSPPPVMEDEGALKDLASCLRSVMPRLERVQWKDPVGTYIIFDEVEWERWRALQRLLEESSF